MKKYEWNLEEIIKYVKESFTFTEVLKKLGIPIRGNNIKTLKKILDTNNIDYTHFTCRAKIYKTNYIKANVYLNNEKNITSAKLKNKLLKENLIENKCSNCGLITWLNKPIVLQLHHKDGNNKNNSLNNLELLCPNCHSQTENYCGNANKNKNKNYCKDCGKEITLKATYCSVCNSKHRRKVKKPSINDLINDFKTILTFTGIGNKYNVSDNTVRKWFKSYNLPFKNKELKEHLKLVL
jgi:hypothetical protein